MEALFNIPLPFQRRLTKMYTDTKSSYDFVKEPVKNAQDPDLLYLHRKLRIQKDRLVSWGLEWSDPALSPDIDESISKAGLSELVGSVMGTIKEILAEAEPLWQSSRNDLRDEDGERKKGIVWDRARFEDLVRDLTMSIDTLYDLSKTRQSARQEMKETTRKIDLAKDEKVFSSTRMATPQQVDPTRLIWPGDSNFTTQGHSQPAKASRHVVFMRGSTNARRTGGPGAPMPVLLERAPYDPIYSVTGITPSMARFEKLFAGLSHAYTAERPMSALLPLIGYYEESELSRFNLLFALPDNFGPIDIRVLTLRMPTICTLSDLLFSPLFEPSLEVKFRLAHNVANAVFDLHSKGIVHGNLMSSNVVFIDYHNIRSPQRDDPSSLEQVNMRQSYLTSYDIFSDVGTDDAPPSPDDVLHRHPLDPRITRYTNLTSESKSLDLYTLGLLLIEIGLWSTLADVFPMLMVPTNPANVFKQLLTRCGSLYVKAIKACWGAPDDELSQRARPDVMHQKVYWRVSKALDACCAIDDVSGDEVDMDQPTPMSSLSRAMSGSLIEGKLPEIKAPELSHENTWPLQRAALKQFEKTHERHEMSSTPSVEPSKSKVKLSLYPSIRISQEHLHCWHTTLMPQINQVLRGFYKKNPESVEISLESVGESSSKTKPTILVFCTSVNKVSKILKKSFSYDKTTYGLKVCRGKVVRSQKRSVKRSMANEEILPANAHYQECPLNGASIGAYVNDQHLPPVSFGGLIMVDDEPYGMSVHHMLDSPSDVSDDESIPARPDSPVLRSSAHTLSVPDLTLSETSYYSSGEEEHSQILSYDSLSEATNSDLDYLSSEESDPGSSSDYELGDVPGIDPRTNGADYIITQPALDDISSDFYPDDETRDDDHLMSCTLGTLHASSGIRRRTEDAVVHEIDWALFAFNPSRAPPSNDIVAGDRYCSAPGPYPTTITPLSELAHLPVHSVARTSGLQRGRISQAMTSLKLYKRSTPSSSYQVFGGRIGVPGDSGAWVMCNVSGAAVGVVLAWSERKGCGYLCPMAVLMRDMGESLNARTICLPGNVTPVWDRRVAELRRSISKPLPPLPRVGDQKASKALEPSHPVHFSESEADRAHACEEVEYEAEDESDPSPAKSIRAGSIGSGQSIKTLKAMRKSSFGSGRSIKSIKSEMASMVGGMNGMEIGKGISSVA